MAAYIQRAIGRQRAVLARGRRPRFIRHHVEGCGSSWRTDMSDNIEARALRWLHARSGTAVAQRCAHTQCTGDSDSRLQERRAPSLPALGRALGLCLLAPCPSPPALAPALRAARCACDRARRAGRLSVVGGPCSCLKEALFT